jgi:RNA polymerase sigma factor (sigma-70 family)
MYSAAPPASELYRTTIEVVDPRRARVICNPLRNYAGLVGIEQPATPGLASHLVPGLRKQQMPTADLPSCTSGNWHSTGRQTANVTSATDWAAWLQSHHHRDLLHVARLSLFGDAYGQEEDIVADAIAEVAYGTLSRLPTTPPEVLAFVKAVVRFKAMHATRRELRFAPMSAAREPSHSPDIHWRTAWLATLARDIDVALSDLTPRERQVSSLHWLHGLRVRDITARLSISDGTVKELLRRSARKLRRSLAAHAT